MTLSDKVNNRCPNKKPGRMTELTEEEEKSLKFYIEYMASINHPLSIPTVKAFAWSIVKKSQQPNCFNTETGPGDKWYNNLKKRNDLTENPTVLIVADPRWLILQFMNNTLLCWKKSSMIWSWQRSLNIFLIVTSPWWLFYFMLFYVILLFYVFIDQSFIPKTKHI